MNHEEHEDHKEEACLKIFVLIVCFVVKVVT